MHDTFYSEETLQPGSPHNTRPSEYGPQRKPTLGFLECDIGVVAAGSATVGLTATLLEGVFCPLKWTHKVWPWGST